MQRVHCFAPVRAVRACALGGLAVALASAAAFGVAQTDAEAATSPRGSVADGAILTDASGAHLRSTKAVPRVLELDIHQPAPPNGYTTFTNTGAAALRISVITDGGGALVDGRPRIDPTSDRAVRYPKHDADVDAPHAVIQVVDRRGADDLDPGTQRFRFGADFNLDDVSEDAAPGGRDNGDNLIQRGLFNQPAQYKIQLDHRIATCRVKGSLGAVSVSSSVNPVVPGTWYRVRCVRVGDQLTLVVTRWQYGIPTKVSRSASGPIGVVSPPRRTIPVSVGGKLRRRGVIDQASDQFNGRIDNVIIRVG
jgi:hypothetical protein